jgi:hypothetical protein
MACCWAQRTLEKWWIFPGFLVSTREKMGGFLNETGSCVKETEEHVMAFEFLQRKTWRCV